ncbi:MAG: formylglycine-generating enzyme family protein [Kiritimatiellae bacterium]|nr:formylglycine-generating enzyme family protein [Kiritimatiellia bacterium]
MKTSILATLATLTLCAAALANPADPQISNFSVSQNASRVVHVAYTLDEPACVTIDVLTNGVSIGGANIQNLVGDVNKLVPAGSHGIDWYAHRSWPGWRFDDPTVSVQVTAWATNAPPDVMDIDLQTKVITYYSGLDFLPDGGLVNDKYRTTHLVMKKVHAAGKTFMMGSPDDGTEYYYAREKVQHPVTFTKDYYLAIYETTRRQYALLGGPAYISVYGAQETPYGTDDPDQCPIGRVLYNSLRGSTECGINWPDTGSSVGNFTLSSSTLTSYLAAIRANIGLDLDIPTEAQWEFACRAGTTTAIYTGKNNTTQWTNPDVHDLAWYTGNSGQAPHAVGRKQPNAWGFYDMYGNYHEWCLDWYEDSYSSASVTDPKGPVSGSQRVIRSAHYWEGSQGMRSAFRFSLSPGSANPYDGFRLCLPLD